MRAAIYIRMSTEKQSDSPERQRAQIRLYCEQHQHRITKEYADEGMQGNRVLFAGKTREDLQQNLLIPACP